MTERPNGSSRESRATVQMNAWTGGSHCLQSPHHPGLMKIDEQHKKRLLDIACAGTSGINH